MQSIRNTRSALIACLCVFSFECIVGRVDTAAAHIRSGLQLLREWLKSSAKKIDFRVVSPEPTSVEHDLLRLFVRLDIHLIVSFLRNPSPPVKTHPQILALDYSEEWPVSPLFFNSLEEAMVCFEHQKARILMFLGSLLVGSPSVSLFNPILGGSRRLQPESHEVMPTQILESIHGCRRDLAAWNIALESLCVRLGNAISMHDRAAISSLRVNSISMDMRLQATEFESEMSFDSLIPAAREIVALSAIQIDYPMIDMAFPISTGVSVPIYWVALKCRDRVIRRQAIALQEKIRYHREGVWNSEVVTKVCKWVMEIEEDGVTTEIIPESSRVRLGSMVIDYEKRICQVQGVRSVPRIRGELVTVKTHITW